VKIGTHTLLGILAAAVLLSGCSRAAGARAVMAETAAAAAPAARRRGFFELSTPEALVKACACLPSTMDTAPESKVRMEARRTAFYDGGKDVLGMRQVAQTEGFEYNPAQRVFVKRDNAAHGACFGFAVSWCSAGETGRLRARRTSVCRHTSAPPPP